MRLPRILILIDWFYPGFKAGGPIQSIRNFVAAMHQDYELYILTSDRDLGDAGPYAGIRQNTWNNYIDQAKVWYAPADQVKAALLQNIIREVQPDWIYLNSMYSLPFTIMPLWLQYRNRITATIVLAPRGMLQAGAMQFKTAKKKVFIKLINLAGLPRQIRFHATDEQEQQDILQYFPATGSPVIATNFPAMQRTDFVPAEKKPGILRMVCISRMAPKKNIHFLLEILATVPADCSINLVFRGEFESEEYLQQCLTLKAALPAHICVSFDGAIENDAIPAFLQQNHIFALPTLGENFGHAIFEAFSAGRPVLISDRTPWRNLADRKAGWDLPLSEPEAFRQVILQLAAMNSEALNLWCKGAWNLANDFVAKTDIREQYKNLFNDDVHSRH